MVGWMSYNLSLKWLIVQQVLHLFLGGSMGDVLEILTDLLDFLVKAVLHYAQTPEGQREFEEIYTKAEQGAAAEAASVATASAQSSRVVRK